MEPGDCNLGIRGRDSDKEGTMIGRQEIRQHQGAHLKGERTNIRTGLGDVSLLNILFDLPFSRISDIVEQP